MPLFVMRLFAKSLCVGIAAGGFVLLVASVAGSRRIASDSFMVVVVQLWLIAAIALVRWVAMRRGCPASR
jgi:hypothetical protein